MNKEILLKQYHLINHELNNENKKLIELLDNTKIENVNLINFHYKIKDLLNKKDNIKNRLYIEYDYLIID